MSPAAPTVADDLAGRGLVGEFAAAFCTGMLAAMTAKTPPTG